MHHNALTAQLAGHPFPTARELDEVALALRLSHRWVLR